jgi:hypothetical protein
LADASELPVPAWEIEILALVLNQLNSPLTSDKVICHESRAEALGAGDFDMQKAFTETHPLHSIRGHRPTVKSMLIGLHSQVGEVRLGPDTDP